MKFRVAPHLEMHVQVLNSKCVRKKRVSSFIFFRLYVMVSLMCWVLLSDATLVNVYGKIPKDTTYLEFAFKTKSALLTPTPPPPAKTIIQFPTTSQLFTKRFFYCAYTFFDFYFSLKLRHVKACVHHQVRLWPHKTGNWQQLHWHFHIKPQYVWFTFPISK